MKVVVLFIFLLTVFVLTPAKPVKENEDESSKNEDKSDVENELENSGDTDDEDEEDGSTTEEPRMRQKRELYEELEDEEKVQDSSGDDSEQEDKEDSDRKEDKTSKKGDHSKNRKHSDSDAKELQLKNTMGIQGPFTITAMQPGRSQGPSPKMKTLDPFSLNFASPPGKIEITPFQPAINSMKKVRRRCMCPFPCGHSFEVIGCGGPYALPCGGGWPGTGCGGFGGYGGMVVPPYGYGGLGGHPLYGGGFGYGGHPGFGGCGGCGGCGCGGGCGGGCGFPPIMMCCCNKNGKDAKEKSSDFPKQKSENRKTVFPGTEQAKPLSPQATPKVNPLL